VFLSRRPSRKLVTGLNLQGVETYTHTHTDRFNTKITTPICRFSISSEEVKFLFMLASNWCSKIAKYVNARWLCAANFHSLTSCHITWIHLQFKCLRPLWIFTRPQLSIMSLVYIMYLLIILPGRKAPWPKANHVMLVMPNYVGRFWCVFFRGSGLIL
jgi:hypothetical protein